MVEISRSVTTPDGVVISIREDQLDDDDLVFIHMGSGSLEAASKAVINNYEDYRGLITDNGLFCLSVFGIINGVTAESVFRAMPQKQYGAAEYGQIKHLVTALPTTIADPDASPEIQKIQRAHFDLVLPIGDEYLSRALSDLSDKQYQALVTKVEHALERLLPYFTPRVRKDI